MITMFGADTPSDWALLLCLVPMVYFGLRFVLAKPRTWYKDPLGWVIVSFNLSVLSLLTLIAYAILFGSAISEPWRLLVAMWVLLSGCAKAFMLERERYRGRLTLPVYEHAGRYTGSGPTIKGE